MSVPASPERDPMRRPEVICLDLDGCLVDSRRAIATCLNRGLEAVGVAPRPDDELHGLIGPPLLEAYEGLLRAAGRDEGLALRCIDAYRTSYREISLTHTTVVPGIPAALESLGQDHVLVVVTSKPTAFARPIVEHLGLDGAFDGVHGPELDELAEPKAVTLARALAEVAVGTDPSRAVMVGDRHHDIDAGTACGCTTVGVTWGSGAREELAGADLVVDTPAELVSSLTGRGSGSDRGPAPTAGHRSAGSPRP
jgi:phosphoglycolate phosphatase